MADFHDRGAEFEQHVKTMLELRGYAVERDVLVEGTQIDLIARSTDPLNDLELLVECNAGGRPVGVKLLKTKAAVLLDADDRRRLVVVSAAGFTNKAKAFGQDRRVTLTTMQELEASLVDLRPYTQWLVEQFEHSEGMFAEARLATTYVPLRCKRLAEDDERDLAATVDEWMRGPQPGLLFILGEYGRGKTSFCRHFTYQRCKAADAGPIPVIINLREYRRSQSLVQIVTDTLLNGYGVRIQSFAHFQRFCASGRVMLVLDGFDEMSESGAAAAARRCFQDIYTLSALSAKTVVTCRTNYFRSHKDLIDLLDGFSMRIGATDDAQELSFKGLATLVEVSPFREVDVFEYLGRRFGTDARGHLDTMRSIHDLTDLSRRPVLLDMICGTLPTLARSAQTINSAALYDIYTKRWTRRDGGRTTLDETVRQDFCEALAWFLHVTEADSLTPALIRDAVVLGLSGAFRSETELDVFLNDIQTCSFLVRSAGDSEYRFAHKSFREFFVARRVVRELVGGRMPTREGVDEFVARRSKRDAEQAVRLERADERVRARAAKKDRARQDAEHPDAEPWRYLDAANLSQPFLLMGDTTAGLSNRRGLGSVAYVSSLTLHQGLERYLATEYALSAPVRRTVDSLVELLKELFLPNQDSGALSALRITPEVATFAIELLLAWQVDPVTFLKRLAEAEERDAFMTLLRRGTTAHYFEAYAPALLQWMEGGTAGPWLEHLAPLVPRYVPRIPDSAVRSMAAGLSSEGLSRFIAALLESTHDYQDAFASCFDARPLTAVQAALCAYGKRQLQTADDLATVELVAELMGTAGASEWGVVEELLRSARYSTARMARTLVAAIRTTTDNMRRFRLACLLETQIGVLTLEQLRGLRGVEQDTAIVDILDGLERRLRDQKSLERLRTADDDARHRLRN